MLHLLQYHLIFQQRNNVQGEKFSLVAQINGLKNIHTQSCTCSSFNWKIKELEQSQFRQRHSRTANWTSTETKLMIIPNHKWINFAYLFLIMIRMMIWLTKRRNIQFLCGNNTSSLGRKNKHVCKILMNLLNLIYFT